MKTIEQLATEYLDRNIDTLPEQVVFHLQSLLTSNQILRTALTEVSDELSSIDSLS